MSPAQIHAAFTNLIAVNRQARARRHAAGISDLLAAQMRRRMRLSPTGVRYDTQLKWLSRAGVDTGMGAAFTAAHMVAFANFCQHPKNEAARKLGTEYLLEKFLAQKQP